jgi:hypothetical protein
MKGRQLAVRGGNPDRAAFALPRRQIPVLIAVQSCRNLTKAARKA